jgi:predicted DNA-binding transcriptional regulator AlpA
LVEELLAPRQTRQAALLGGVSGKLESSGDEDLLPKSQVLRETTWSETTLWRRIRAGAFPAPLKIGPGSTGRVAWTRGDVKSWKAGLYRTDGRPAGIVRLSEGS